MDILRREQVKHGQQDLYSPTNHQWRKTNGGLRIDQVLRLRDVLQQNSRLKLIVADLTSDNLIIKDALKRNDQPGKAAPVSMNWNKPVWHTSARQPRLHPLQWDLWSIWLNNISREECSYLPCMLLRMPKHKRFSLGIRLTVAMLPKIMNCWSRKKYRMKQRLDYKLVAPEGYKVMLGLEYYVHHSGLEGILLELVKTRASQINHCAWCLGMHTKDARALGETEQRLYLVSAWREAPFYSERERAALAWAEAVTMISQDEISDELYLLMPPQRARQAWTRVRQVGSDLPGRASPGFVEFLYQRHGFRILTN